MIIIIVASCCGFKVCLYLCLTLSLGLSVCLSVCPSVCLSVCGLEFIHQCGCVALCSVNVLLQSSNICFFSHQTSVSCPILVNTCTCHDDYCQPIISVTIINNILSIPDTIGTAQSVLIKEVSSFQR